MFQSSPAITRRCNTTEYRVSKSSLRVSILTGDHSPVQQARHIAKCYLFIVSILTGDHSPVQPIDEVLLDFVMFEFQSSPAITRRCNEVSQNPAPRGKAFQSSPAITRRCNLVPPRCVFAGFCFNPHRRSLAGATHDIMVI